MKIIKNIITECSINQIVKLDVSRLTKISALNQETLFWVKGILFSLIELDSEEIIKYQTQGKLFFDTLSLADCKKKPDSLKFNGFEVQVIDYTGYSMYEDLITSVLENEK